MDKEILKKRLGDAIEESSWSVDWSETDGRDVREILELHLGGKKVIKENLDTLIGLLHDAPKEHCMNKWMQELICCELGGKPKTFIKD